MSAKPVNSGAAAAAAAAPQQDAKCLICKTTLEKVAMCAACKMPWAVCGKPKECQKADWPRHKPECKARQIANQAPAVAMGTFSANLIGGGAAGNAKQAQVQLKIDKAKTLMAEGQQERQDAVATMQTEQAILERLQRECLALAELGDEELEKRGQMDTLLSSYSNLEATQARFNAANEKFKSANNKVDAAVALSEEAKRDAHELQAASQALLPQAQEALRLMQQTGTADVVAQILQATGVTEALFGQGATMTPEGAAQMLNALRVDPADGKKK